jgi:ParB/RepB/Spo0J family partition protein
MKSPVDEKQLTADSGEAPLIEKIWIEEIAPSQTNARKSFNTERMADLEASMRSHGFIEAFPLLLRPKAGPSESISAITSYELVCGERRWRTAKKLGIQWVPAVVRQMSDVEAEEISLIENLQRDDLNPLEEAEGYRHLLGLCDGGQPVHTVVSLAEKIGRTPSHVYDRLKLCRLSGTAAGDALSNGNLPASQARLIARIPSPSIRDTVTETVLANPYGASPMPVVELQRMIREKFMRELRGAKFSQDDECLVPMQLDAAGERTLGGACEDCPWNTKNSTEDDAPKGGKGSGAKQWMCTNPDCFRAKTEAHYEAWRAAVAAERPEVQTLSMTENEHVLDCFDGKTIGNHSGLVELKEKPNDWEMSDKGKAENKQPWAKLVEGQGVPVILVRDNAGKIHEVAKKELVVAAATMAHPEFFKGEEPKGKKTNEPKRVIEDQGVKRAREQEKRIIEETERAICEQVLGASKMPEAFWNFIFTGLIEAFEAATYGEEIAEMAAEIGWDSEAPVEDEDENNAVAFLCDRVRGLPVNQKLAFITKLLLICGDSESLSTFSGIFEVDEKAIVKRVKAEFADIEKAEKAKSAMMQGLKWKTTKDAVTFFCWNEHNVCLNPDVCTIEFPKKEKIVASVSVGRSKKGWHFGYGYHVGKGDMRGSGSPVASTATSYSTRELALRSGILAIYEQLESQPGLDAALTVLDGYIAVVEGDEPPGSEAFAAAPKEENDDLAIFLEQAKELRAIDPMGFNVTKVMETFVCPREDAQRLVDMTIDAVYAEEKKANPEAVEPEVAAKPVKAKRGGKKGAK